MKSKHLKINIIHGKELQSKISTAMKRKMVEKTVNRVFLKNVRVVSITTKRTGSNITVEVPARWTINKRPVYLKVSIRNTVSFEKIKINDCIDVTGFIRAYSLRPATEDGTWKKYQYIVAESISKSKTLLERDYGIDGNLYGAAEAYCLLSGRIVNVSESNGWQNATIIVDYDNDDRKASYVRINYKIRHNKRLVKDDFITTSCAIYSDRKNIRGMLMDFEDIIIRDFSVVTHVTATDINESKSKQPELMQPQLAEA